MSITYSTAKANCFRTDDGGIGSSVATVKPSTDGIASVPASPDRLNSGRIASDA